MRLLLAVLLMFIGFGVALLGLILMWCEVDSGAMSFERLTFDTLLTGGGYGFLLLMGFLAMRLSSRPR